MTDADNLHVRPHAKPGRAAWRNPAITRINNI